MSESSSRFWEIFLSVFETLPRQGPGDRASTSQALAMCKELPQNSKILDLGSGAGAQTMTLLEITDGTIVAVDTHAPFIDMIHAKAEAQGAESRVTALSADMADLKFEPQTFDLIWSEGALYNVGIPKALEICHPLLRSGGYLAFTDAVWKKDGAPDAVKALFEDYATMGSVLNIIQNVTDSPFELVGHFPLPDDAWWTDFYTPLLARVAELRAQHTDPEALAALDTIEAEALLRRDFADFYTYEFFICRKANQ